MKIKRLDHVNLYTSNLAQMVEWYDRVLEIKSGPRPNFPFPGAWLYVAGDPVVHMSQVEKERASVEPRIEHFAFQAEGLKKLVDRLNQFGIEHSVDEVPGLPITQVNLADFDGNHIHIDFTSETL